jgi:hypothetical protein
MNYPYGSESRDWKIYINVPQNAEEGIYSVKYKVLTGAANPEFDSRGNYIGVDESSLSADEDYYYSDVNIVNPQRIEAESKIKRVGDAIKNAKSLGVKIPDLENQFSIAESKMQNKNYTEVINSMISINSDITLRIVLFNQAKDTLNRANSNIKELEPILFASVIESNRLISQAEGFFDEGDYSNAETYGLKALKEIETEKVRAEQTKIPTLR